MTYVHVYNWNLYTHKFASLWINFWNGTIFVLYNYAKSMENNTHTQKCLLYNVKKWCNFVIVVGADKNVATANAM